MTLYLGNNEVSQKVLLNQTVGSNLPEITTETSGKILSNNGTELEWVDKPSGKIIGSFGYTLDEVVPNGGAWCDGAEYTKAQFPDVYAKLANGSLSSISYEEYQQQIADFGFCETFGLGSTTKKYYAWLRDDGTPFYTLSETPEIGEYIYDGSFEIYGVIQYVFENQITVTTNISTFAVDPEHGNVYERDSSQDMEVADDNAEKKFKVPTVNHFRKLVKQETSGDQWYKWYDDGWVEQGGYVTGTGNASQQQTITFIKPFADTNYVVNPSDLRGNVDANYFNLIIEASRTIESVTFSGSVNRSWTACGYGAIPDTTTKIKRAYVVLYTGAVEASVAQAAEFINALTNKANTDLSNVSSNIDYVVESYQNGTEWYRIYKSGWVEQGGRAVQTSKYSTVALLKEMDINYTVEITNSNTTSEHKGSSYSSFEAYNFQSNAFTVYSDYYTSDKTIDWTARGQGASE